MKAEELRIGNLIYGVSDRIEEVVEIRKETAITAHPHPKMGDDFECEYKYFSPIPLTEEWLLKFEENLSFETVITKTKMVEIFIQGVFITTLDWVHEYQNLYHAMNGTELTLNQ